MNDAGAAAHRGGVLPGLDGLRAIAVLLVILCHQHILSIGWIGVQIFFVLSGYLITRLLERAASAPLPAYLRDFYGRRALRIFPLYYAYLALIALALAFGLNASGVTERLPYAVFYLSNFFEATTDGQSSKLLMHFWSLAVEEQFYLVWPFLIYLCPRRFLRGALIAIVLLGPLFRLSVAGRFDFPGYLTICHVDAFAVGGLSALYPLGLRRHTGLIAAGVIGAAGIACLSMEQPTERGALGWGYVFGCSLINGASALLIEALVRNHFVPGFFQHRVPRYLGKISYGLYVLHYPVQSMVEKALPAAPVSVRLLVQVAVAIGIASASFALLESPFLALKERWFPTTSRRMDQPVGVT